MNRLMLDDLLRRLGRLEDRHVQHRTGVVTTISPLAVALGGAAIPYTNCKRLASYTPVVADTVSVLTVGNDLIVLGKIV